MTLDKNPLEALARAWALRENTDGFPAVDTLYLNALDSSKAAFQSAVDSGRWSDAIRLYSSLSVLSHPPAEWTTDLLRKRQSDAWNEAGNRILTALEMPVASTPEDEAPSTAIVARMIRGTVTVWVDRGLRIEGGVGYADRVIGSGFFIDDRGYFITNYHVIASEVDPSYEGFSRLYIKLAGDTETRIPARVIGWDPVLDIALVKTEIQPPAVFQLGSSSDLKVGNRIYAIGSPAGLEQTLTSGIVSAQNRRLLSLGSILQIDAPINQGNSGGPIVDESGRVQAIVFAGIEQFEGLNFAIPVEYLRILLPSLYEGGKISHSWLGGHGRTATLPGSTQSVGVRVFYAVAGGPLDVAGIPKGAIITAVSGTQVRTLEDVQNALIRERPESIIRIDGLLVSPDGSTTSRHWFVYVQARPEKPGLQIVNSDIPSRALLPLTGFELEPVGNTKRYLVSSVVRGSIADESGFSEQDVVEIREFRVDEKAGFVTIQLFTKRRKSGYLDAFIGLFASLDSPSYF